MTIFAASLFVLSVFLTIYALWGRDWLKSKPWAQAFFDWIEPIEIALFRKSPTILFARLKVLTGLLLTWLTAAGDIDLTPILPFVPEKYQGLINGAAKALPLVLSLVGWADESLRKKTTLPIELVAVPEATATPEVKVAIGKAQEAKEHAVATVKAA
jgi:hypothetical protein